LVPLRLHTANNNNNNNNNSSNNQPLNSKPSVTTTLSDIDLQKENKFKQIIEQSNVDLSK